MTHRLRTCPRLVAATSALALAGVLIPVATAGADTVTNTYTVPGTYSLTIPLNTTSVQVIAAGASGTPGADAGAEAGPGGNGGLGSLVNVTEPVAAGTSIAPGDDVDVVVGAHGGAGQGGSGNEEGGGGGGGGGAGIVLDETSAGTLLAGAGGGGGGGGGGGAFPSYNGGAGGHGNSGEGGSGEGSGSGGAIGGGCATFTFGADGGSASGGTDAGGGGGAGDGACGGAGGAAGSGGGGGGGGGGAGNSAYDSVGTGSIGVVTSAGDASVELVFTRSSAAPVFTSASIASVQLSSGTVNFHVTASGFPSPTLALSGAPSWVSFDPNSGVLSGTIPARTRGTFPMFFTAANGVLPNATQEFLLSVSASEPGPVPPGTLRGNVTKPFSVQLKETGGVLPVTWSVHDGVLPAGLKLSSAGLISGTPTQTGGDVFDVGVTDSAIPQPVTAVIPVNVFISPRKLMITTTAPAAATAGKAYSQTLSAIMGIAPLRWSIAAGALPKGLSLNASTGKLSGTPTQTGTSSFTVKVTDATKPTAMAATAKLSLTIRPAVQAAVYVVQGGYSGVLSFSLGANGNVAPLTTITGSATTLDGTGAVAIDPSGRIYVANEDNATISEYAYGVTGNVAPSSVLGGSATGLAEPSALAVDSAGRLYVANPAANTITVYPPLAGGDQRPIATIGGPLTGLDGPEALTFGPGGDLWVANLFTNSLTAYRPTANGNVAPVATIAGSDTGLDGPQAMTLDAAGHLLVADTYSSTLTEYPTTDNGNDGPLREILGTATGLSFPDGVDVDTVGNIYVANQFGGVTKYAPGASGNATPLATISGAATGLSAPGKVAVAPPLSVKTQRLGKTRVGRRYGWQLKAYLGTTPYHWKKIHGRLPKGIHLSRGGKLYGKPKHRGAYRFTVRLTDSTRPRMTATARLVLHVRKR
jgi:sugar lactone lactonase YvrE